ncbi:SAM-dependent methyltransferase [Sphingobium sp. TA15]|uniref:SAM-dependent methyltransferase n=1 Tax=Sphingobium indicum (strain DSM 16413 / CCM 7287 / MTCC 6362 / UT26 / NBRC 101211 / UT26S) TaxID=452662 RepID=D4Z4T0_SPHIU|nr:DUF938 domain-containing protein [Sphingobium indicum]BAI97612.1 conserved hypothetical protein [Sphingobium indicum UT26S]BDD67020.1 SAM-dependent methyltransferase [Sphingobium sp. TA15]
MTDGPEPWEPGSGPAAAGKRHAPATARNRDAILAVLREELPSSGLVLEVASGSGEHAVHFAAALPALDWQPSDPDPAALASIEAWREEAGLANVRPPIRLDAAADWPVEAADAVLCINMVHISEWAATAGLFKGRAKLLPAGAPLIIYGPFLEADVETAPTNRAFDRSLKARNPEWGLRDVADLDRVGEAFGLAQVRRMEMPANNLILIYRSRRS